MKNGFYLEFDQLKLDLLDEGEEIETTFEFMESTCYDNPDPQATFKSISAYFTFFIYVQLPYSTTIPIISNIKY